RVAPLPRGRLAGVARAQGSPRPDLVPNRVRLPLRVLPADRTADQPGEALPGGDRLAQAPAADVPDRGGGAARVERHGVRDGRVRPGDLWVCGVGTDGELATLPCEPATAVAAGGDRVARGDNPRVAAPGLPLGDGAAAVPTGAQGAAEREVGRYRPVSSRT